jgi:nucleobase:cation symporter-1, NCS1 family
MSTKSTTKLHDANLAQANYGEKVLTVEPYGTETVRGNDRHGKPSGQFTIWLGSNLTIADYALGFLPISLGMSWGWSIAAILVGNLLGSFVLALCAAMGPAYGQPQMMIGRYSFGRIGGYLPALLNYISTIGWFTVNNILGAFGLRVLFPHLAFWQGAVLLVLIQSLLAIYGHNLIHWYERVMSVVLGILFIIATVIAIRHHGALVSYHPTMHSPWTLFGIMVAAAFSYIGSWGTYASDYSRYLPANTSRGRVGLFAFLGAFVASVWLELVGAAVAVIANNPKLNSIASLHTVMGGFGTFSVIAIILGGTAADALNLYSNSLSAGALNIKLPRWLLAVAAGVIGLILSVWGSGNFESNFDGFLLLLGYWMTPWMGILFADFYVFKAYRNSSQDVRNQSCVYAPGLISFLAGLAVSIPFMDAPNFVGPFAKAMNGLDLTFYVGFVVAFGLYLLLARSGHRKLRSL